MQSNIRILIALCAAVIILAGCRRVDERDFIVDLPTATQADEMVLRQALKPYGGVLDKTVKFDAEKHQMTLRYDSMQIAKKNIEMALALAGFTANGVTPESVGAKSKK